MTRASTLALLCSALVLSAGCDNRAAGGDGGATCSTDPECDDGFECTQDSCGVDMRCRHIALDERCDDGLFCVVGRGCAATRSCTSDAECDDTFECTIDTCGVGGICNHTALNERCADPTPMCVVGEGCIADDRCNNATDCDDSVACTMDSCTVDRECRNTPMNDRCTGTDEVCNPTAGCIVITPCDEPADCDDGDFCNGAEVCSAEFGCSPAESPRMCNDNDDCTIDSCDSSADQCAFACDSSRPECNCPTPDITCEGTFALTPAPSDNCALGMVNYNLSTVTFSMIAGTLSVQPQQSHVGALADTSPPVCPEFEAQAMEPGANPEIFTLRGTFTDDDNFTGTFTSDYPGGAADCNGGSLISPGPNSRTINVTGVRQ